MGDRWITRKIIGTFNVKGGRLETQFGAVFLLSFLKFFDFLAGINIVLCFDLDCLHICWLLPVFNGFNTE